MRENTLDLNIELLIYYLRLKYLECIDEVANRDVDKGIEIYIKKVF